jgi:hypothetical protein
MAGTAGHPKYTLGGSDTVRVSTAVTKGQGLEADASNPGYAKPWSAGSTTRLGVAQISGNVPASNLEGNMAPAREYVTVQRAPQVVRMKFAANCGWRVGVIAAANGQVTPVGGSPAFGTLVGYCDEPEGVTSGGVGAVELI